jgi:putative phosphoesterase
MKLMIASDIHGSAFYCSKMIEAYKREKADKLLLLGDLLYHGPRNDLPKEYAPKKVIEMLNGIKEEILCVRGNCDTEVDQMVLEFPVMAEYCILYLDNRMVFATHGHKFNTVDKPLLKKGDILLNGHTHVPKCEQMEEFIYMNPGSVSIPKESSAHSYMIWDKEFIWKDLEGNIYYTEAL